MIQADTVVNCTCLKYCPHRNTPRGLWDKLPFFLNVPIKRNRIRAANMAVIYHRVSRALYQSEARKAAQQKHWDRWRCEREKTEARKTLPTITRLVLYPMCKTEKKRIHHNAQDCLSPSRNGFWQENKSLGLFNTFYIFFISVLIEKPN